MFGNIAKDVKVGGVLRYMFMPQILPRIGQLYSTGFWQLAYSIALVYRAVGILPATHPVFRRENKYHLGLRDVLAAAGSELKFTRDNIDKIIIYFAVMVGLVILAVQFAMVLAYVMMNPALASGMPTTYAGFFETPVYSKDVAYRILYMVFGVPELFYPGQPVRPFHTALYSLFQLYSIGLLIVALIIAFYMVFAILVETAQTGVPFGKRYNQVWAPIRFIFALGLLIPAGYGLNSAQWITLYAAKFGSDFATRGWVIFNDTMRDAYLNKTEERVGLPQTPELTNLAAYMMVATACEYAYSRLYTGNDAKVIKPYLVSSTAERGGEPPTIVSMGYNEALKYFKGGDILIRFGDFDVSQNGKWLSNSVPYCGDLIVFSGDATEPGARFIQAYYYVLVRNMWTEDFLRKQGKAFIEHYSSDVKLRGNSPLPGAAFKTAVVEQFGIVTDRVVQDAVKRQSESKTWDKQVEQVKELGWGGAGIWYNKIAQINGSLVTAVNNVPQPKAMPSVLEYVKAEKLQQDTNVTKPTALTLADGREIKFDTATDKAVAEGLNAVFEYWTKEDTRQDDLANQTRSTNNIIIDVINVIFGTRGLFDMCQSTKVHPLAQLSILGKGLVEASIRNLAMAVGISPLTMIPVSFVGVAAGAAAKLLLTVATITITIGFILFYVIPFMPFLYFFFAVGGWVKGLFEAMVGVPLWALAHMRIDGEGLPGEGASSGYFLIFEIFLRPILIVFGLLASVIIFAAMVKVLNEVFYLVVVNLAGHDETSKTLCGQISGTSGGGTNSSGNDNAVSFFRGPIDELFFTVLYAIIVYMIGMSCFKLIDLVPNNLLRYMNVSVQTFNDQASDPAEGLVTRLSIGSNLVTQQLKGIGEGAASAAGNTFKGGMELAAPPKDPKA